MPFFTRRSPFFMAAVLFSTVPAFAADGLSIKPGLWEVRTFTKTQGMPSDVPPVPARSEECITKDMLKGDSDLQLLVGRQGDCKLSNRRQEEIAGNAPTVWFMECENRNFRIRGDANLLPISPGRYIGTVAFESESYAGDKVQGEIRFVGKRLGGCPTN